MAELKYPKGEKGWVSYYSRGGRLLFIITSKENSREWYYLYAVDGTNLKKLGRAHTPTELEDKYDVLEKMHEE